MSKGTVTLDYSNASRGFAAYMGMWLWVGWIAFYFFFILSLPLLYLYAKTVLTTIVGIMILSAVTTIDRKKQPKWGYALGKWAMYRAAEFFRIKLVLEDPTAVENSGVAIFALEPHDVLPLSIFALNDFFGGIKGHSTLGCLTGACFKIPLMRHMYTWVNAHSIDKKSVQKMLANKISPVLCPGGVQEVLLMENDSECVLFLKSRMGFVKLAMQNDAALVPVFSFGLRNMFSFWAPKSKFVKSIGRQIGFLPMLFFGMWGVPFGPAKPCTSCSILSDTIR